MESIPYRVNGRFKLDNTEHTLRGGWHKQGLPSVKGFLRGHGSWPPSGPASLQLLYLEASLASSVSSRTNPTKGLPL